ncbi:hypothetical protein M427DRAFT_60678 [Gonapodya prolifera JEL478]|uniref:Uncharacterized protein n=1 Tax=Gonapodya prolifera (strain JEL478) TaxID=1344416 RepID=A0A139A3T0_GONPJ|nr:hypothetical protein M427DRAFT_60678 [Gonapodya prolifera JEL478]|eukprot:KXS11441.1 hypothetical protein M427DRAFT_60678 [Gonapodya prolifera JEL478]
MGALGPATFDFVHQQMPNVTYSSAKFCVLLDERALRRYTPSLTEELHELQALQLIFEVPAFARLQRSLTPHVDGALDEYSDVTVVRENAKLLLPGLEIRPVLCSSSELNPNQSEECASNPYAAQRCFRCLHSATCRDCGTFYPEARSGNGFALSWYEMIMYRWCSGCIPEWVKCTDRDCLKEMCGVCSEDSCCSCGEGPFCQAHLSDGNGDFSHWKTCRAGVDHAG